MNLRVLLFLALAISWLSIPSIVLAVPDTNAPIVQLRHPDLGGCVVEGVTLQNCFTTITSLNNWITTRKPSAVNPLIVEISPGSFTGTLTCSNGGHTTYRGSGFGTSLQSRGPFVINVNNCTNLTFDSFRITGNCGIICVLWLNGGNSFWSDMIVDINGIFWNEGDSCAAAPGKHYWFNSRITAKHKPGFGAIAYYATCDENWFLSSEVTAVATPGTPANAQILPILAIGGELHLYGGVIRAIADPGVTLNAPVYDADKRHIYGLVAASASSNAEIHIHGTGIDVISSTANTVAALAVASNGMIHANQSSFLMNNSGTNIRIFNDSGHVHAPYLWEEHPAPPNIVSVTGADLAVVTDGGQPRLVIYSSNCASRWFDTSINDCHP